MKRNNALIGVLCLIALLGTFYGPVMVQVASEMSVAMRARRQLIEAARLRAEHPTEPLFAVRCPEAILRAAAARTVRVHRLSPLPDKACADTDRRDCFLDHRVLGEVPVEGMTWGRRLLAWVMKLDLLFVWSDRRGNARLAPAHMEYRYLGDPGADSTLQRLELLLTR
jgi:hypothetical protein